MKPKKETRMNPSPKPKNSKTPASLQQATGAKPQVPSERAMYIAKRNIYKKLALRFGHHCAHCV
jgi:hypothetical protein